MNLTNKNQNQQQKKREDISSETGEVIKSRTQGEKYLLEKGPKHTIKNSEQRSLDEPENSGNQTETITECTEAIKKEAKK